MDLLIRRRRRIRLSSQPPATAPGGNSAGGYTFVACSYDPARVMDLKKIPSRRASTAHESFEKVLISIRCVRRVLAVNPFVDLRSSFRVPDPLAVVRAARRPPSVP